MHDWIYLGIFKTSFYRMGKTIPSTKSISDTRYCSFVNFGNTTRIDFH